MREFTKCEKQSIKSTVSHARILRTDLRHRATSFVRAAPILGNERRHVGIVITITIAYARAGVLSRTEPSTRCTPLVSPPSAARESALGGTSPVILAGSAYFSTNTSADHYPPSPPLDPRDFVAYNRGTVESRAREATGAVQSALWKIVAPWPALHPRKAIGAIIRRELPRECMICAKMIVTRCHGDVSSQFSLQKRF